MASNNNLFRFKKKILDILTNFRSASTSCGSIISRRLLIPWFLQSHMHQFFLTEGKLNNPQLKVLIVHALWCCDRSPKDFGTLFVKTFYTTCRATSDGLLPCVTPGNNMRTRRQTKNSGIALPWDNRGDHPSWEKLSEVETYAIRRNPYTQRNESSGLKQPG